MDRRIRAVEKQFGKATVPTLRPGETIRVHQKIREGNKDRISIFEGVVIALKHGSGLSGSFTVRRIAAGVGVERVFPLHLPSIVKVETLKSTPIRRNKLYYLRGLTSRALKRRGESKHAQLWQDLTVLEELKQIETEKAAAAAEKEAEKAEAEAARLAKIESALESHQTEVKPEAVKE